MPQTTTYANACDVQVYLDDSDGVPVNVSGSSNNVSVSISRNLGSLVTFEGNFDIVTACKRSGTVSFGAVYSTAADEARELLEGWAFGDDNGENSRTLRIDVPNSEPGSMRYLVEAVIESYELPLDASSADPIAVSAQLRTTGEFTRSVIVS